MALPAVFIGSSAEGLPIVRAFEEALTGKVAPVPWTDPGIFTPSRFTLESLEKALDRFTYAILVLSPDDTTHSRGMQEISARDNVVFELGLFVGRRGRSSTFIAVPDSLQLRIPTDFLGFTPVRYKIVEKDGQRTYDVSDAAKQIIREIEGRRGVHATQSRPSHFWDVLSDSILIVYGHEPETGARRHRISRRDLETAWELKTFFDRRYPNKQVRSIASTQPGLEQLIQAGADLIVVGGFVTNAEFAKHRVRYENFFRLKMGRLCFVDGQFVHVPEFDPLNGLPQPDRSDAFGIEALPSEYLSRDYGYVFNGMLHIYGQDRRVIAIAGVKGHGTRGAALYLNADRLNVDAHLKNPLTASDTLELAVAVDVVNDIVDSVEPLKVILNDAPIYEKAVRRGQPCELGRPCEGCDFGLFHPKKPREKSLAQAKAIVFDLDDTLLDTFNSLIVPLEMEAAKAMISAGAKEEDPTTLAATLLKLRRIDPANLEAELRKNIPGITRKILSARNALLTRVALDNIFLSPEVLQLLRRLRNRFELYLLTSGKLRFQNRKIDRLNIRKLFLEVLVMPDSSSASKMNALRALAERRGFKTENIVVVGNRLDNEIVAANTLGMPAVWVRHGEGSGLQPVSGSGVPDYTLAHVLEITALLGT